jgi:hypothetical protein
MIGVPTLANAVMMGFVAAFINAKFKALERRFDAFDKRFDGMLDRGAAGPNR